MVVDVSSDVPSFDSVHSPSPFDSERGSRRWEATSSRERPDGSRCAVAGHSPIARGTPGVGSGVGSAMASASVRRRRRDGERARDVLQGDRDGVAGSAGGLEHHLRPIDLAPDPQAGMSRIRRRLTRPLSRAGRSVGLRPMPTGSSANGERLPNSRSRVGCTCAIGTPWTSCFPSVNRINAGRTASAGRCLAATRHGGDVVGVVADLRRERGIQARSIGDGGPLRQSAKRATVDGCWNSLSSTQPG